MSWALQHLRRRAALGLRIWLILAILLRVTRLRDSLQIFALVFYTTPWPVIAAGLAGLALHHGVDRRWHPMRRYLVLCGGALFAWVATSWQSAAPSAEAGMLRVVQWNVARPDERLPSVTAWLRKQQADVICVAEAQPRDRDTLARWQAAFPEYVLQASPGEMLCLVRGEIVHSESGLLAPGSWRALHRVRVREREYLILQVDICAAPLRSRREPLQHLAELARAHARERLLVIGDFNTPSDSAHLDALRREMTLCFSAAGTGLSETWPMPLPVLCLDQIWAARPLRPLRAYIGFPLLSDHRPVVVDLQ